LLARHEEFVALDEVDMIIVAGINPVK